MNARTATGAEMEMNADQLWREEIYTDLRLGTIRRLVPVTAEGERDENRSVRYSGEARIMTPAGMLPLSFEIPAASLAEAVAGFGKAAERAIEETARELEELRRETASGIVMPGAEDIGRIAGGGSNPAGGAGGGLITP